MHSQVNSSLILNQRSINSLKQKRKISSGFKVPDESHYQHFNIYGTQNKFLTLFKDQNLKFPSKIYEKLQKSDFSSFSQFFKSLHSK